MRVVNATEIEYTVPGTRHREGDIRFKYLLRGRAGSPQNYELLLARTGAGFPSPAHHHNFDQIRFGLSGVFGDGKGTEVRAGQCGYYPEGAWYSIDAQESEVILLQFGGASGCGFTHFPQLFQAYSELSQLGEFRGGRFYRTGSQGDPEANVQDGYEALWQHINGKPLVYPLARYSRPVIMNPDAYGWCPYQPGSHRKVLGVFTERGIEMGLLKVDARRALVYPAPPAPCLLYLLQGCAEVGGTKWVPGTTAELIKGDVLRLDALDETLLFYSVLPAFDSNEPASF